MWFTVKKVSIPPNEDYDSIVGRGHQTRAAAEKKAVRLSKTGPERFEVQDHPSETNASVTVLVSFAQGGTLYHSDAEG